jgi:hypothetical protein
MRCVCPSFVLQGTQSGWACWLCFGSSVPLSRQTHVAHPLALFTLTHYSGDQHAVAHFTGFPGLVTTKACAVFALLSGAVRVCWEEVRARTFLLAVVGLDAPGWHLVCCVEMRSSLAVMALGAHHVGAWFVVRCCATRVDAYWIENVPVTLIQNACALLVCPTHSSTPFVQWLQGFVHARLYLMQRTPPHSRQACMGVSSGPAEPSVCLCEEVPPCVVYSVCGLDLCCGTAARHVAQRQCSAA